MKINVRGVDFDNVTLDETMDLIRERIKRGEKTIVFTPNSEVVQACIEDNSLYSVINQADIIIPDGIGVVKAAKLLGTPLKGKVAGYDLGERVIAESSKTGLRLFFFGGSPSFNSDETCTVADAAAKKMTEKYPGASIAGTRHGYFKKDGADNDETIRIINESHADVLYVCFGVPAQEKWILENRDRMPDVKLFLALGGSLDGYSGNVKRAPKIFIDLSLEWFYRLLCQPSRIGRMTRLPKFYFGTLLWKIKNKK